MTHRVVFTIICLLTLISCSHKHHDSRLSAVAAIVSDCPEEAIRTLDSIDRETLGEDDHHYYDFLTIKARDNANMRHNSDTLYLSVLDYYSQHPSWSCYPEVLYYGGKVYTDLGDYSTALKFFQAAEDILSDSDNDRELKGRVLSQMGRLLNSLYLFDEGVACLKKSINIDRELNDTVGEVSDLQLLGGIYLRAQQIPEAEKYFRLALNKSQNLDSTHRAKSSMYLGAAKYRLGEIDSALIYIHETPARVHPMERSRALSYAIKIYYDAGLKDSAFIYACQLIESKDTRYTPTAYSVLLSTELRNRLSAYTISKYQSDYLSLLESYYSEDQTNMTVNQQLLHNYDLHLKHRQEAERFNIILKRTVGVITLLALTMAVIILSLKNRNKNNVIKLHIALENITRLENIIKKPQTSSQPSYSDDNTTPTSNRDEESIHTLRQRLRTKLLGLYNTGNPSSALTPSILQSDTFTKLQSYIEDSREIKESDPLWDELKKTVLESSPNFIGNLRLLTGGKLNSYDLHTALLIKCGVTPTQMTHLLNRTKGAIVSRRESLCYRVFDKQLGTKVIDGIIQLL